MKIHCTIYCTQIKIIFKFNNNLGATSGTAVASLSYALNFIHPCSGATVHVSK